MKKYLVHNQEVISNHTDINTDFQFEKLEPFIKRVEKNLICKYISRFQYNTFLDPDISDVDVLEVIDHLEASICNLALMNAMVHFQNSVGNVGADEDNKREWWRDRDLVRSYRTLGMESLDEALTLMAHRLDLFEPYRNSDEFAKAQHLIIKSPQDISKYININNSRLTFEALISIMNYIQISEFSTIDETIFRNPSSDVQHQGVSKLKGIIAHRTKAQILISNKFVFDGLGFSYKIELLPWEMHVKTDKYLLEKRIDIELEAANVYRDQLWKLMDANKDEFNLPEVKTIDFVTKNQSSLGLI